MFQKQIYDSLHILNECTQKLWERLAWSRKKLHIEFGGTVLRQLYAFIESDF